MDEPRNAAFLGGLPIAADPTTIDRVLTELWGPASDTEHGASRLALGTIVIGAEERDAAVVEGYCQRLAAVYPCRMIVVLVGDEPELRATIQATCRPATEGGPLVCGETIVLRTRLADEQRLPGIILPLLLPDVLATLWWCLRQAPTQVARTEVLPLIDRLLVDSSSSEASLELLALQAEWPATADLTWFAQRSWREAVAQLFDAEPAASAEVDRLAIITASRHQPGAVEAALLGGWAAGQLGWKPAHRAGDGHSTWRRPDGSTGHVDLTWNGQQVPRNSCAVQALTLSADSGEWVWRVSQHDGPHTSLALEARRNGISQVPRLLPLDVLDPVDEVLAALERPLRNDTRTRTARYASWLLGG